MILPLPKSQWNVAMVAPGFSVVDRDPSRMVVNGTSSDLDLAVSMYAYGSVTTPCASSLCTLLSKKSTM